MNENPTLSPDRLYDLLPVVYRQRDAGQGYPLRALMQVISEQVNLVEGDIQQLYENWFVETSEDWVVPYIGELVGYRLAHEAGEPGDVTTEQGRQHNKILISRREVANVIRYRRRKGTLALLEELAFAVAGWPARAVEFYKLLGLYQHVNHVRLGHGRTVDLRNGDALDQINTAFATSAHTVDLRRINSHRQRRYFNIPNVGLFVWRLRSYPVTKTIAYYLEELDEPSYTISVLGNDAPLYTRAVAEADPTDIASELNVPVPIRRRALEQNLSSYYGPGKSLQIWRGKDRNGSMQAVPAADIVPADLTGWHYRPQPGQIAVDPELGRITLSPSDDFENDLWVSYSYGFSADIGGGEYKRQLAQPAAAIVYRVVKDPAENRREFYRIRDAIQRWTEDKPLHAVIEIAESGAYVDHLEIPLAENQSLQIRAASEVRPVIRLLDYQTGGPDALSVRGAPGARFTIDGLVITGRGVRVSGDLDAVDIRHTTLVPGWTLKPDCDPRRPNEPSLVLNNTQACISVGYSIIGSIRVRQDEVTTDPIPISICDSILDATSSELKALYAPSWPLAHATLTIRRSTVIGTIETHAIALAENSIFDGEITVARRQLGCMRFCYVTPGSRTPRHYNCQPDLVQQAAASQIRRDEETRSGRSLTRADERPLQPMIDQALQKEADRVRPFFNNLRYGTPTYCQLANACADEIKQGAEDESEMGAYHHLYQPQRAANLRARLEEYAPAGMEAGIIFAS